MKKNNEFLNLNNHKQNKHTSDVINIEDISIKEDSSIKDLKQELLCRPYEQKEMYIIQREHVNSMSIYGNKGNSLFNKPKQKSICNKICEFFKNLFCCGCDCVQTKD